MIRLRTALPAVCAMLLVAASARPFSVTIDALSEISGSGGFLSGDVIVSFEDFNDGVDDFVKLSIDASDLDTATFDEKITGIYFNGPELATTPDGTTTYADDLVNGFFVDSDGPAATKANGCCNFSNYLDFNTSGTIFPDDDAATPLTVMYLLDSNDATLFNQMTTDGGAKGDWTVVLRIQDVQTTDSDSGFFGGNPDTDTVVPEPSTYLLFGTGLFLVGWLRRRSAR